ncbi:hypothetical protein BKA62DRAFT_703790 [Auriculariales sp. MPI-PUGE-AT-0066]|nr:hypothetical protein BKA62DRAFT_703790 [Auriculariales sp. MPI-PUGE-AT-0066]
MQRTLTFPIQYHPSESFADTLPSLQSLVALSPSNYRVVHWIHMARRQLRVSALGDMTIFLLPDELLAHIIVMLDGCGRDVLACAHTSRKMRTIARGDGAFSFWAKLSTTEPNRDRLPELITAFAHHLREIVEVRARVKVLIQVDPSEFGRTGTSFEPFYKSKRLETMRHAWSHALHAVAEASRAGRVETLDVEAPEDAMRDLLGAMRFPAPVLSSIRLIVQSKHGDELEADSGVIFDNEFLAGSAPRLKTVALLGFLFPCSSISAFHNVSVLSYTSKTFPHPSTLAPHFLVATAVTLTADMDMIETHSDDNCAQLVKLERLQLNQLDYNPYVSFSLVKAAQAFAHVTPNIQQIMLGPGRQYGSSVHDEDVAACIDAFIPPPGALSLKASRLVQIPSEYRSALASDAWNDRSASSLILELTPLETLDDRLAVVQYEGDENHLWLSPDFDFTNRIERITLPFFLTLLSSGFVLHLSRRQNVQELFIDFADPDGVLWSQQWLADVRESVLELDVDNDERGVWCPRTPHGFFAYPHATTIVLFTSDESLARVPRRYPSCLLSSRYTHQPCRFELRLENVLLDAELDA